MKWIGLTGNIASGKTTVANVLREQAIPIIDADQISHQALRIEQDRILNYFGNGILGEDGQIDRRKLGEKVFSSQKSREVLEGILHPLIQKKVAEKRALLESAGYHWAVYDVPLLFENKLEDQFDAILLVIAPDKLRLERLVDRKGLTEEEAKQRMATQMDPEQKKTKAHFVIENDGDVDQLRERVLAWKATIDSKYS
ncbi:MAG: dephospho-CoA kinase [Bdellovibrionales bacterium]|nr:dephospho-CoA kinase [Bdellovibrionales bacterium]